MPVSPHPSSDDSSVNTALRLGWAVGEARGRYRLGDDSRLAPVATLPSRMDHALPLASERSTAEQRIEIEHVLVELSRQLDVDPANYGTLPGQSAVVEGTPASVRLADLAGELAGARRNGTAAEIQTAWATLAEFLYGWDAHIQDALAAQAFGTASAYQLGRSLAETYWALDPTAPGDAASSWEFLLGQHRRDETIALLNRLAAHFNPLTVHAVTFSLRAWCALAADPSRRNQTAAVPQLAAQSKLWRDLLVTGQDPTSMLDPRALLRRSRQLRGLIRSFVPEIVGLGLMLAALLGAAKLVGPSGSGGSAVVAALSALGLTTAGLAARAKASANQVFEHLRTTLYQDLVDAAVTLCPASTRSPAAASPSVNGIDHLVVLALENRSFDHLLGFLDHPDPSFDGLLRGGPHTNPGWQGQPPVRATEDAKAVLPVDPDHSHDAVMEQLALQPDRPLSAPNNQGFVASYERKGRGLDRPQLRGIFGWLITRLRPKSAFAEPIINRGGLVMRCQDPTNVPVLSTLALEFGVCTRWFCSVPGETWPNRNFMHAATSDGETDISLRFYNDKTIFELLEANNRTWSIYHDDTPQVWAFRQLWDDDKRQANWFEFRAFLDHVKAGTLSNYSFIEPNHRPPLHTLDYAPVVGQTDVSNSQHPGNNLVSNAAYDNFSPVGPTDFSRAETLIATVYETLRANPALFERSILLITYDEHGGLYDHVPPPTDVPAPRDRATWGRRLMHLLYHRTSKAFDFKMLGPRVPAIVISPLVRRGAVSTEIRDHASVPATLRHLFAPHADPLTDRDAWALPFDTLLAGTAARRGAQLPDLSSYIHFRPAESPMVTTPDSAPVGSPPTVEPRHARDFRQLAEDVHAELVRKGAAQPLTASHPDQRAHEATAAFVALAVQARRNFDEQATPPSRTTQAS